MKHKVISVKQTRNYVMRASQFVNLPAAAVTPRRTQKKRKTRSDSALLKSSPSGSIKKRKKDVGLDSDNSRGSEEGEYTLVRPKVSEVVDVDQYEETNYANAKELIEEEDGTQHNQQGGFDLQTDEEEKPKPTLQLRYEGFGIHGHCLCVVAEPWPTIHSTTRSLGDLGKHAILKSKEKQAALSTIITRAQTPLFLTDEDDTQSQHSTPVTNSLDDLDTMEVSDDSKMGGMMAFSQVLNMAGDAGPGAVEDEDEIGGAVLFGDADKARQL